MCWVNHDVTPTWPTLEGLVRARGDVDDLKRGLVELEVERLQLLVRRVLQCGRVRYARRRPAFSVMKLSIACLGEVGSSRLAQNRQLLVEQSLLRLDGAGGGLGIV